MYTVIRFTRDPILQGAREITRKVLEAMPAAAAVAQYGSQVDTADYWAVYAEGGEQVAGFAAGERVL